MAVFLSHAALLDLPFFWDEVGQFIPAALDLFQSGSLVPHSATPNIHPPGVMAYLAGVWTVFGYSIVATRAAMLLLASLTVLTVFLLAIKLSIGVTGVPGFLVVLLLCAEPLFYAQAMLAQLDMAAMLFTTLALLLFLEERIFLAAVACIFLVLVKETGLAVPVLFACWLAIERRFLQAAYFALPVIALGGWLMLLSSRTGNLFGSAEFAQYNIQYLAHPVRAGVCLSRRLYYLFFENFHWIGTVGLLGACLGVFQVPKTAARQVFGSRHWKIALAVAAIHLAMFSVVGGAMLERYLLPILPILFIAMIAGWSLWPAPWRVAAPVGFIIGVGASNFWNPPYPFPYENNLAFIEFVRLHATAAGFVERNYPHAKIITAWPLSAALTRSEFGYVKAPFRTTTLRDFSEGAIAGLEKDTVEVFILFSRAWNPPESLMQQPLVMRFWRRFFEYQTQVSSLEVDERLHLKTVAAWSQGGQWIEVHAKNDIVRAAEMR